MKPPAPAVMTEAKAAVQPERAAAVATQPKGVTVELSIPTQARLLYQQGKTIDQIAYQLSLDIPTVTNYINSMK